MGNGISIRHSAIEDMDRIMEIYESAKRYMRSKGNLNQWTDGYPYRDTILSDIAHYSHYLAEDEEGNILMVFSFILGDDPTYKKIEGGKWLNDKPYGTIHRIASSGLQGGMLDACVKYCKGIIDNIRIDTHADNGPMQNALHRLDFKCCGIIHISDGSPRLAFQKDFRPSITLDIKF